MEDAEDGVVAAEGFEEEFPVVGIGGIEGEGGAERLFGVGGVPEFFEVEDADLEVDEGGFGVVFEGGAEGFDLGVDVGGGAVVPPVLAGGGEGADGGGVGIEGAGWSAAERAEGKSPRERQLKP